MKFFVHKLGCPKNDVDADYISARLIDEGHEPAGSPEEAESIIVNTCGFILPAKQESVNELLRLGRLKKSGQLRTLYAAGCLAQRNGDELLKGMPELDGSFGLGALDSIAQAVSSSRRTDTTVKMESRKLGYLSWKNRFIADSLPYSYLKISDGCDRGCTYCAIPLMRGKFRSRPMEGVVREAEYLARNGKKELILVSQEATMYGYGLPGRPTIVDLLKELEQIDGVEWIRLMYLHPAMLDDKVINYLLSGTKTLPYFDLPLQHVNSALLRNMHRQIDRPGIQRLLSNIRDKGAPATIRTTFIVGFPGETEVQFEELRDFIADQQFDRLGVFTYSREDDTPAAQLAGQVPEETKVRRMDELMTVQRDIAFANNQALIGSELAVVIDSVTAEGAGTGRTKADCPDIDQEVTVRGHDLKTGDIVKVKIDRVEGYDLVGTVIAG
ncbi:MAG: 30S ribosomal protein S12 methylthiotransferase RimO [Candidatus Zixiibacteriota bacterium]